MNVRILPILLFGSLGLLAGCAITSEPIAREAASSTMSGSVYGGQQPITSSTVTVWQMGTTGYGTGATQLASTTTDGNGRFSFAANAYTCAYNNAPVYLTAQAGNSGAGNNPNLMLAAGIGPCGTAQAAVLDINELTTAATAFALGQFFTTIQGVAATSDFFGGTAPGNGTYNAGLVAANSVTIPTLVNLMSGTTNPNTTTRVIESAKLSSIANTLSACVNSTGQTSNTETTTFCGKLFSDTIAPGSSTRPLDTLQAAVNMSLYPYQNVTALYNLAVPASPYVGLSTAPNDWTVAVSYVTSTLGLGINQNTSSNIDIDASGRVWFPTNTATNHGVAFFDPASGSFNGPYSTGLTHPQYVAIDTTANVWSTDLSSAKVVTTSTATPSTAGATYLATAGVSGGPLAVDDDNTVLFASTDTSGNHNMGKVQSGVVGTDNHAAFQGIPTGFSFNGKASNSGGIHQLFAATSSVSIGCSEEFSGTGVGNNNQYDSGGSCAAGGIAETSYNGGFTDWLMSATTLNKVGSNGPDDFFTPPVPISAPEGIATDGAGHLWLANSGNGSVSTLAVNVVNYADSDYHPISPVAYLHDSTHGGTMTAPYGLALDRSGNVWVSNASCVATTATACTPTGFTLTQIIGAAAPTITPLSAQSQSQIATKPTAVSIGTERTKAAQGTPKHVR